MAEENPTTPLRCCTRCQREFPATTQHFGKQANGKYGLSSWCKQCRAKYQRGYFTVPENRDRHAKNVARFRVNNPGYVEDEKRAGREYRKQKRDSGEQYKYLKEWYKTPKGRLYQTAKRSRRVARERLASVDGTYSPEDIRVQMKSQKEKCWHCGKLLKNTFHIDHLIPLKKGGTNNPRNIVISCPRCNMSKGDKLTQDWNGRLF